MRCSRLAALFLLLLLCLTAIPAPAPAAEAPKKAQPVLVLTAFGSTQDDRGTIFQVVADRVRQKYPDVRIERAWTSVHYSMTRKDPAKDAPGLALVLSRLGTEGCRTVAVQSLHVAPGAEFDAVRDTAERFDGMPNLIGHTACGGPLLDTVDDVSAVADGLARAYPLKAGEALVLTGHGARTGVGTLAYPALEAALRRHNPHYYVDSLENLGVKDGLGPILKKMHRDGIKRVYLLPMLFTSGEHVHNDIFGQKPESRLNRIASAGFEVVPVHKTLADLPEAADILAAHAEAALAELGFAPAGGK